MHRRSLALVPFALLALLTAGAPAQTRPWTPDDVVFQERDFDFRLAPQGDHVLWLRSRPDREEDQSFTTLWTLALDGGEPRALTVGRDRISDPTYSWDGMRVTFLSDRELPAGGKPIPKEEKGPQLWELDLRGGEARPLTRVPHGVRDHQVLEDAIYFTARERRTLRELELAKRKDGSQVVEDPIALAEGGSALFRLDPATGDVRRVVDEDGPLLGFRVAPDGRHVVTWHASSPSFEAEGRVPPRWFVRRLGGAWKQELFADRRSKPRAVAWERDGRGLYLLHPHASVDGEDSGAVTHLARVTLDPFAVQPVDLGWEAGLSSAAFEVLEDGFLAGLCEGVRPRIARFRRVADGTVEPTELEVDGDLVLHSLTKARDGAAVVFVTGTASDPDHVFVGELAGTRIAEPREILRPNRGFEGLWIARSEVLRYEGAGGDEVEALLYYPRDYAPGVRHPLVLITHGGPHGADHDRFSERWSNSPNLYAQRGAFVLKVNYHGSSDYGLEFGESIKGRYYELELIDLCAGIQALIEQGKVDAERMGLVGWSNGAILSIAMLTLAPRYAPGYEFQFRACAPGAGDVNWTSDYGNCSFGAVFDDYYLGGPPWEMPEVYLAKSPLFEAERVTTPTILFFGTEDTSVPTSQGWEWYRALHVLDQAPVRFLLFPGEGHGLRKPSHQRRKLVEELAWFDEHLFGKPVEAARVKEGSPLERLRLAREHARVGGRYGVVVGGALVPQTVPFDGNEIGCFEVTVAQWQAFDPTFARGVPEPLRALPNHPATGITPADAEAYLAWLGERTGASWRLPDEAEWKRLEKAAGPEENTFDWWVGYEPPPAEEGALRALLLDLGLGTVLGDVAGRAPGRLKTPAGERFVYGVGGNAAELVRAGDGVKPLGRSVLSSPDARVASHVPPADVVGLRVIRTAATGRAEDR